jgi:hypothetical protein
MRCPSQSHVREPKKVNILISIIFYYSYITLVLGRQGRQR